MDTPVSIVLSARFGMDVESLLEFFPQLKVETKKVLKTRMKYRIQGNGDMVLAFLEKLKSLSFSEADISMSDIRFSSVDQAIEYLKALASKEKEAERESDKIEARKKCEAVTELRSFTRIDEIHRKKKDEVRRLRKEPEEVFYLREYNSRIDHSFISMFDRIGYNEETTAVPVKRIAHETATKPETEPKDDVNAAVFSPAKVKAGSRMLVQVFLYLDEEGDEVVSKAKEADEEAERRGYAPLDFPLARKEVVTVQLAFDDIAYLETKSVVWKGRMRKMDFIVKVPKDAPESFFGEVTVSAQGLPLGSMVFKTAAVKYKEPLLHADVTAIDYQRIFVSYAHADEDKIKYLIEGYRSLGRTVDFFYDRMSLQPGDEYPDQILDYIDHADLFVLCWSENAANSQWVGIEKKRALDRYQRESGSRLRLYPISIKPSADLPNDMRDRFHFGVVN